MSTIDGKVIQRVRLHMPEFGGDRVDVSTTEGAPRTGVRVALVVGGLSRIVTVRPSRAGLDGPAAWHGVAFGGSDWDTYLGKVHASYQGDPGVKLSTVLRDLAADCGETLAAKGQLGAAVDVVIGPWWQRPIDVPGDPTRRYRGRDALAALRAGGYVGPWWIDGAGVTRFDARPVAVIPDAKARVLGRDLALGRRTIGTDVAPLFVPGAVFEGRKIRAVVFSEDAGELRIVSWES